MWFMENAWLVPLIPAVSFVLILLFGKRLPRGGAEVGIGAVGASFVLSVGAAWQWINRVMDAEDAEGDAEVEHAFGALGALGRSISKLGAQEEHGPTIVEPIVRHTTWFQNGGVQLGAGIQIDGLTVVLMFVVTIISLLVHVYSVEYMRGDRRFTHFYATLSLFTASMLLLVVADNTLQMLVGWELVGLCSFMLIGHWWEEKPNSDAALKAFLTTRTGDIGLLVGVIMTFFIVQAGTGEGSFNIVALNESVESGGVSHTLVLWCAVGLMFGIIGKSGQFPLHTWLPDAMAGPTPVSALIHAATMVVAGVFLGARLFPVFYEGFSIGDGNINFMAAIGGITVLIGAALAFVQDDIKKVLAYSTISQLGYMVMALGVGAWVAAVFHLFTHAFFKANLFLGAGSVSHSGAHHSFDMKKDMGGLKKYMPQTFWTFMIGSVALAGIFPLAGFWSKDEILVNANENDYRPVPRRRAHRRLHDGGVHDALRVPHVLRRVPRRPSRRSARPRRRRRARRARPRRCPARRRSRAPRRAAREQRSHHGAAVDLVVLLAVRRPAERAGHREVHRVVRTALRLPRAAARRVLDRVGRALRDRRAARRGSVVRVLLAEPRTAAAQRAQPRSRTRASSSSSRSTTWTCSTPM